MSIEAEAIRYGERAWQKVVSEYHSCFGCDARHYTECPNTNCTMQRQERLNEHVIEVVGGGDRVVQQCACGWSGEMRYYTVLATLVGEAEAHLRNVP